MPPPTEQGFQPRPSGRVGLALVAMPPPTEQGFQRHRCCRGDLLGRSQCLLQQNKDFNLILTQIGIFVCGRNAPSNRTRVSTLNNDNYLYLSVIVAMPPPTEQGFQPDGMSSQKEAWLRSQCPLQQNKDFNNRRDGAI